MLLFDGALGVIAIGVWIFCIIDVITTPEDQVRNLPKLLWLVIVILLMDIGSIAWLFAGRPWSAKAQAKRGASVDSGWGTPTRAPAKASNPDDDEEFLAGLRTRAEEQRRRARDTKQGEEPPGGNSPTA